MKRKRIHNDIKVTWVFLQDDLPYVIDQEKSKVYLHSPFGKSEISDFAVSENVVEWTFYGKDQKIPGKYSLTLSVNEGEEGMVTIDKCNFVELVSCSCKEGGSDECNVRTESIDLVSNISLGGGGGSYDDTKIKKDIADLQEKDKATDAELAELSAETNDIKQKLYGKEDLVGEIKTTFHNTLAKLSLKANTEYAIKLTLAAEVAEAIYPRLYDMSGQQLTGGTMGVGLTEFLIEYTPSEDIEVELRVNIVNGNPNLVGTQCQIVVETRGAILERLSKLEELSEIPYVTNKIIEL